jgi:hypothetical protein
VAQQGWLLRKNDELQKYISCKCTFKEHFPQIPSKPAQLKKTARLTHWRFGFARPQARESA